MEGGLGIKYFITEAERKERHSTLLFEFQKGKKCDKYWLDDSLCLHADIFDELMLYELFSKSIPKFSYYGLTEVTQKDWEIMRLLAPEYGSAKEDVISELTPWVDNCFKKEKIFTICGI